MLFNITDSLCDYSQENKEEVIICVSNLLLGYCESKLLLRVSRRVIDHFSSLITDIKAQKALKYLDRTSYTARAYGDIIYYIDVVLSKTKNNSKRELDYKFFQDSSSIQKAILLCEDMTDCNFYMLLTKELFEHCNICADKQTGGGSGMKKKLEDLIQTNAVVLAIVDSDKMYPKKPDYGNTAESCLSVYNNSFPNIYLRITDTHEAENLIPLEYVVKHCSKNYAGNDFIQKLKRKNALHYLKHYDYKNGIKYEAIADNDAYYEYAKEIYEVLYSTDFDKHVQATRRKPKDKQYIFPPINSVILEKYVSNKSSSSKMILDYAYATIDKNRVFRQEICKLVLAFTCARTNEPIN